MKRFTYKLSLIIVVALVFTTLLSGCKGEERGSTKPETVINNETEPTGGPAEESEVVGTEGVEDLAGTEDAEDEAGATAEAEPAGYAMHYGSADVKEESIYAEDFEDGQTDFVGRGAAKVEIVDKASEGTSSILVSGRTELWNGAIVDLTQQLAVNENYILRAFVLYEEGPDTVQIDCKVEKNNAEYLNFASTKAKKGEWSEITGSIIIPEGTTSAEVYFETGAANGEFIDFYIDGFTVIKEMATVDRGELPALKEAYKELFSVGVAATANEIPEYRQGLITEQFNSITPGNELKADSVLDYATCISDSKYDDNPAVKFDRVKPILDFAKENGIPVRGHTLVWHSQTPRWFFAVGYSNAANAPLVSKELMLKRMENYIKQVIEYTQSNYPNLIYAWDVVNEAVNPGDGEDGSYRSADSLWYQVIGPEFIEKAFEYARKYDKEATKLFYNDYNTEDSARMLAILAIVKDLKEKGLIDGIGLQCHFTIDSPSLIDVDTSIRRYGELGLEIHITELDMGMEENTEEAYLRQAKRYKRLFTILKSIDEAGTANITNVTFWGLSDDVSWLNETDKPSYPLLFDKFLLQKPAFWGVILSPDIPLY